MLYNILVIIFVLAFIYSVIYQIKYLIVLNNKEELDKKSNSITMAQSVLKDNNTNIYIVKTNNSRRSHYDVRRNAIRLDDRDYDSNKIGSVSNAISLAIDAIVTNKKNRFFYLVANYINKAAIVICVVCIYLNDLIFLTFGMVLFLACLIFKYINLNKEMDVLNKEIDIIKKDYKLKDKELEKLYNNIVIILYNELSFNLLK